jgi:hypothetical protein
MKYMMMMMMMRYLMVTFWDKNAITIVGVDKIFDGDKETETSILYNWNILFREC